MATWSNVQSIGYYADIGFHMDYDGVSRVFYMNNTSGTYTIRSYNKDTDIVTVLSDGSSFGGDSPNSGTQPLYVNGDLFALVGGSLYKWVSGTT